MAERDDFFANPNESPLSGARYLTFLLSNTVAQAIDCRSLKPKFAERRWKSIRFFAFFL